MKRFGMILLWLVLGSGMLGAAAAASLAEVEAAFAAGRFEAAMATGAALGTADGDTLVARAALVEAAYLAPRDKRLAYLTQAEAAARRALGRDPDHVEAMLHLVIALGYRARTMGRMAAHNAGLGAEAKALLDRAVVLAPDDPWVWAVLGGWHGEIVASGGSFFGNLLYGATLDKADAAFARALALAPDNPAIPVEYAKMLLRVSPRKYADRAHAILAADATRPPRTAFEQILKQQGADLLRALESGKAAAVRAALHRVVPFAD